jgi:hypothetical protein
VVDAELDAVAGVRAETAEPDVVQAAGAQRPWWETDRRFADRFRAVDDAD